MSGNIQFFGGGSGGRVRTRVPGKTFYTFDEAAEYYAQIYSGIRVATGAAVVLRSDDSGVNDLNVLMPELDSRGLNGSFSQTLEIDDDGGFTRLTPAQIKTIATHGHETINHSVHHRDPSPGDAVSDIRGFQQYMVDNDIHCDSFIQPGTWSDAKAGIYVASEAEIGWYANLMRGNFAASGAYVDDPSKLGVTHPFPAFRKYGGEHQENLDNNTVAQIKADIDEVIARNGYFHILLHGYLLNSGSFLTTADYQSILDYIVTKRDAGQLDVLTFTGSIFATRGPYINLIADPGFELSNVPLIGWPGPGWVGWETFSGTPSTEITGVALAGAQVGRTSDVNVIRWRCPNNTFRKGQLTIYARSRVAANCTARVNVYNSGGSSPDYTRDTAVTNGAWTKITIALGPRGPGAASFRFTLSSADGNEVIWDQAQLIKR